MLNVNETIDSIKPCYKIRCFGLKIWRKPKSPYLCTVFFIVLDLRLTKGWSKALLLFLWSNGGVHLLSGSDIRYRTTEKNPCNVFLSVTV